MTVDVKDAPAVSVPPASKDPGARKKKRDDIPPLPNYVEETLEERGLKLPIGIRQADGSLLRDFSLRVWNTRTEKEVGKKQKGIKTIGAFVSRLLALLCSKIGPHDWSGEQPGLAQKMSEISGLYAGDVFFMYCALRLEALGEDFKLKIKCPHCEHAFDWIADLNTLDIHSVKSEDDLVWTYKLLKPFTFRGQAVSKLKMSHMRWRTIEAMTLNALEAGNVKPITVAGHIIGINDDPDPIAVTADEIDEISKRDLEWIISEINERFVGPKMSIELECENNDCKRQMVQAIPIDYQDFFSVSSR